MKPSTKFGLNVGTCVVLAIGPVTAKLLYKKYVEPPANATVQETDYVGNFLKAIEETFEAGSELKENRNLESAINVENSASRALLLLQLYMPEMEHARFLTCSDYIRAAIRCSEGMELVQGKEYEDSKKHIDHYKKTIDFRIRIARALMSPEKNYQDLASELVTAMTWECMNPDFKLWVHRNYPHMIPKKYSNSN